MNTSELCFLPAVELARLIRAKQVSARQVTEAHLAQIGRVNPKVNAVVTLVAQRAMEQAAEADRRLARGQDVGPLHGLPVVHKDLFLTQGIRTTFGSPIYKDFVPDQDALVVERAAHAGAVTLGKTNTPEFGAGSQTYNEVFGETLNPYDITKTCGGSSGGAAVALACGMTPLASGSDMGGSLRNPASFCNVVGLRPSPGRVPAWPVEVAWFPIAVEGPIARTVQDVALLLSAIAGPDPRAPISIAEPGSRIARPLARDFRGVKIAWSRDLGGLPVESAVTSAIDAQRPVLEQLGCHVDDDHPDLADADQIFRTWRAWWFELRLAELLDIHRDKIKQTVIWEAEQGKKLTGRQIARAEQKRTQLYHHVRQFMERYEFLILPVSQVAPFDVDERYVTEINGQPMETYIDWMKSCYFITVTGLPAISVPCGFTADGLPVGLQIVGRHQDDFGVLQLAYAFQQATEFWKRKPPVVD